MKPTVRSITSDMVAEQRSLDLIVAGLNDEQWSLPTPSPRWAVRDQIAHLAFFDEHAAVSINEPEAFAEHRNDFIQRVSGSVGAAEEVQFERTRLMSPSQLLEHWRSQRDRLAEAATKCTDSDRIEWYGPSMGARSFLTARLMETWAHGRDVCDAVGADPEPTDRLRHIAQLGYITRRWTYLNRGLRVPEGDVRVDLESPSGDAWTWGPPDAESQVQGKALDFCLVTAQRRNVADTALTIEGSAAHDWLNKAQLFAGPPSDPPPAQKR